jgi:NitT/TauT family transport system substrate-binding protein
VASAVGVPKPSAVSSPSPVAAAAAPGTPAPRPLPTRTTVQIAMPVQGVESYAAILLAKRFGEFDKENLDVNFSILPVPDAIVVLQSGQLDMYPLGIAAPFLNAVAQGSDVVTAGALPGFPESSKTGYWIRSELVPPSGQVDPCTLKGKTVSPGGAQGIGSSTVAVIQPLLDTCNLTLKDLTISTLGGGDLLAGLQSGAVDLGNLPDPFWQDPDQKGYAKPLVLFPKGLVLGGYLFGSSRHQDARAQAIMRALIRTTRTYLQGDYHSNPEVRSALAAELGVPDSTLANSGSLVFDPNMSFATDVIDALQKIWLGYGGVLNYSQPLPADKMVDNSIVQGALN